MNNDVVRQISGITNQILNTTFNLQKVNNDTAQSLDSQQISGVENLISTSTRHIKEFAQAKSIEEAVLTQVRVSNEVREMSAVQTEGNIAILNDSWNQLETMIKTQMNTIFEKAKAGTT